MSLHSRLFPDDGDADREATCPLGYIRRRLGRVGYGDRRMVTYCKLLIAEHDFPTPLPTLIKSKLTREVVSGSVWIRAAVDAWIEDFLPPDAAANLDRAHQRAAAADMDAAAGNLRLIAGGRA